MPTGERPAQRGWQRQHGPHQRPAGFTYLAVLLLLALWSALVAGWAQRSQQAAQREQELELLFRGGQIAGAIAAWRAATPAPTTPPTAEPDDTSPPVPPAPAGPPDLQSLLDDRRGAVPRHHLRQLYADPFTGRPDWVLITNAQQQVLGVRSRVAKPRLLLGHAPGGDPAAATGPLLSDWIFRAAPVGVLAADG